MAASDHSALIALLGPNHPPDTFLSTIWDQTALLISPTDRAEPSTSAPFDGLLTLADMDHLLMLTNLPNSQAELLLFEKLRYVDTYANPHSAFASGASIIVNHADKVWPAANALCARLGRGFRYAFANLYFTPHASQTAPPHSDDRDVFILQLHGRKHWLVWPTPHALATRRPFADEQAGKEEGAPHLQPEDLGPPLIDCVLEPGSVLYIPRGALHVADTASVDEHECSLHLTIAIPTADLCVGGFVLNAVKAKCFGERAFRKALPLGPLPTLPPSAALHARRTSKDELPLDVSSEGGDASSSSGSGSSSLDAWRAMHKELWDAAHSAVGLPEAIHELDARMDDHRRRQLDALNSNQHRYHEGSKRGWPGALSLWPGTKLRKIVPLQLIKPDGEVGDKRVAQATPLPGGPGRHAYIHAPPEMLKPLTAFCQWEVGTVFALSELPARHDFLRACVARALLGLGVIVPLPPVSQGA